MYGLLRLLIDGLCLYPRNEPWRCVSVILGYCRRDFALAFISLFYSWYYLHRRVTPHTKPDVPSMVDVMGTARTARSLHEQTRLHAYRWLDGLVSAISPRGGSYATIFN